MLNDWEETLPQLPVCSSCTGPYAGLCYKGSKAPQGLFSGSVVTWGQRLYLTVGKGCWLGSLPKQVYRMESIVARVFCLFFLVRQDWRLYSAIGCGWNLFPCPGSAVEQIAHLEWLIGWALNQAELPTELPGQMGPLAQLCRWAHPVSGISDVYSCKQACNLPRSECWLLYVPASLSIPSR